MPLGVAVPFDAGYGTTWYSYVAAVLCTWNKGGIQQCHVDGKDVVDFWVTPWGRVISTDPVVKALKPVIVAFIRAATFFAR